MGTTPKPEFRVFVEDLARVGSRAKISGPRYI